LALLEVGTSGPSAGGVLDVVASAGAGDDGADMSSGREGTDGWWLGGAEGIEASVSFEDSDELLRAGPGVEAE
jgi:hypothetical protein